MSYQALYRSYRPTHFKDVAGQQHVIKTIKNSLINNRTSHAYLFSGPRGIGKTTIARILAKALNCSNCQDGEPCNVCISCQNINNNESQDVIELDAASNNGVDEIRSILEKVNFLPVVGRFKIYIIDEVHMLSISAFNALLKTLEEPPHHVVFVLATTEPHKIPLTIMSRCQRFDFKPLTTKEIVNKLKEVAELEEITYQDGVLENIAETAEGGMRDALGILDQVYAYCNNTITVNDVDNVTGRISNVKLLELMKLFVEHDASTALEVVNELIDMGKEVNRIIQNMLLLTRDLLLYKSVNNTLHHKTIFDNPQFVEIAKVVERHKLFYFVEVLNDALNKVKTTTFQKIYLEVAVMKLANATAEDYITNSGNHSNIDNESSIIISDLEEQINRLKNQINSIEEANEKLKIGEFQEEIRGKITFFENVVSKTVITPLELEARLEVLEKQSLNENIQPNNYDLEIEQLRKQIANSDYSEQINELKEEISRVSLDVQPKTDNTIIYSSDILDLESRLDDLAKAVAKVQNDILNVNTLSSENNEDENLVFNVEDFSDTTYDTLFEEITKVKVQIASLSNVSFVEEITTLRNFNLETSNRVEQLADSLSVTNQNIEKINEDLAKLQEISPATSNDLVYKMEKEIIEIKRYSFQLAGQFKQLEEKLTVNKKEVIEHQSITPEKITDNEIEQPVQEPIKEVLVKEEPQKPIIVEEVVKELDAETAKYYDHKVLEAAMHQSRDRKYTNDRERVQSMWRTMPQKVNPSLLNYAKMLTDGKMVLYSGNFIALIYPTAPICNQLMNPDNHFLAKQVLKTVFGKEYEFMALPENTWQEKKNEYYDQYYGGTKFPKLSPFKNPELRINTKASEIFAPKKSFAEAKAIEIFGEELVKKQ